MITVPQATEKIIKRSRYLTEAMAKDLINASSLARYIQPEVEELVFKPVTRGSIIMAIKRLSKRLKPQSRPMSIFDSAPDMIVRSNLTLFFVRNSPTLLKKLCFVEEKSSLKQKKALFSYGRVETMILANKMTTEYVQDILQTEAISKHFSEVSSITIHMPENAVVSPGVFNFFIKSLAWEDINLLGMLTTQTEITFIFGSENIHAAFGVLQSMFATDETR